MAFSLILIFKIFLMRHLYIFLASIILLTTSCDPLTDCIIPTRPGLPSKTFSTVFSGAYFEESLRAGIDNEPQDNSYYYYFSINNLPPGLDYESDGRVLYIFGSPKQKGDFEFEVYLDVEPIFFVDDSNGILEDGDLLCESTTSRRYRIQVR